MLTNAFLFLVFKKILKNKNKNEIVIEHTLKFTWTQYFESLNLEGQVMFHGLLDPI